MNSTTKLVRLSKFRVKTTATGSCMQFSTIPLVPYDFTDLKVTRITAYKVDLPLHEGSYKWGDGKSVTSFDATVVRIETNHGIIGYGESTPLGPNYLPAYAEGIRSGLQVIGQSIIGLNPCSLSKLNNVMDRSLVGHPYVKSAVDVACWDILGKVSGLPVCELLGGRYDKNFQLYRAITQGSPEDMAKNVEKYVDMGYRKFQLKVGGDAVQDIARIKAVRKLLDKKTEEIKMKSVYNKENGYVYGPEEYDETDLHIPLFCDANTGWLRHQAMQVINAVKDLDVFIEQPCLTYEECLSVRKMCPLPFILDESIDNIGTLVRMISDNAGDAINLKISKVGGLTKARAIRDLAQSAGIPMNIEDTWGGDIVTATVAHLAHSTDPRFLLCSTDFNSYGPVTIASTTAHRHMGRMAAPSEPGLGVEPLYEVLGRPIVDIF